MSDLSVPEATSDLKAPTQQAPLASKKRPGRPPASPAVPAQQKQGAPGQPAVTLRSVKPKMFAPSSLRPLGYGETEILTIDIPAGWTSADILKPITWANVVGPIAANPAKTQVDRIGSLIYANGPRFIAWLRINEILRDDMKNPCGIDVRCIGPSVDLKTGRPCPLDLATGLPWVDMPEIAEAV